jgi:hypothetical protein
MVEVVGNLIDFLQKFRDNLVGFVGIELENTRHLNFHEPEDILPRNLAKKGRSKWLQAHIDMGYGSIHIFGILKFLVFVNAFFDKYFFKRRK